ncbi:PREDICTED: probable disease resistance protein At5g66900 [Nicotiana attenuata]|uniref:Disease resistance protein n=1 Tax=Nicotiana attenuata TaxID=49451 RepID=A0A1J6HZT9_NICAT|nr:PREDICTED: probable disease resistance protein At5g66900 [Nicotiana attenuata]OIS97841.1 putative disease resistance protein [Nicotiana attenuata]
MAATLLGGAALGPVFDMLLKAVIDVGIKIATFRSKFQSLNNTLNDIKPVFDDIERLNKALDGRECEIEMFKKQLLAGEELVRKCSKTKCYDALKKWNYSRKLTKLENSLVRFCQVHGFIQVCRDSKIILVNVIEHGKKLDQISSMLRDISLTNGTSIGFTNSNGSSGWMNGGNSFGSTNGNGFSGWSDVPQVSDSVVGFDLPLQELKVKLLEEKEQVVVLSAPAGCGKTTLAAMVCQEDDIKDKYRDIFFVTVSKTANIKRIVGEIFEMKGYKGPDFASEYAAICQLNSLLRRSTSQPVLLVLDDVWSESDFVIESFIFQIPGFKILVTSRSVFPKFDTYKLNLLSEKDAKALFNSSAFKDSIPNVRLDLVHTVVRSCCGFPLALKVVGRSLCGQPELIWFNRVMLQSKRQILFPTENDLLRTLRASIDALDEIDLYSSEATTLRDCYLDLGSFPEDHRIHASALLDMWVERYNLDEDGMKAMAIFFQLSSENLVNLALARKDAPAVLGLHNLHYIQQHDLLRELVIHQCDENTVEERKRLYINIKGNDFPKWWSQQRLQPLQAEVLSIFTDEDFVSDWYNVQFPKVEVLVLNFEAKTYNLPPFVEQMSQLKTLIVTNNYFFPTKLNNFQFCSLLNLKRISLERISVTSIFTANLQLPNLRKISFIMCEIGEAFENYAANMSYMWPKLVEMNIEYCNDLVEVPAEICDLVDLKKLSICYCHELVALPEELGKLTNLEVLRLHSCTKLSELPKSVVKLNRLGFLDVYDCVELDFLPTEMDQLCSLRTICMGSRLGFTELPDSVLRLVKLEDVVCDEETASLWEYYKEHLRNLRITVIKEDINLNLLHKSL